MCLCAGQWPFCFRSLGKPLIIDNAVIKSGGVALLYKEKVPCWHTKQLIHGVDGWQVSVLCPIIKHRLIVIITLWTRQVHYTNKNIEVVENSGYIPTKTLL